MPGKRAKRPVRVAASFTRPAAFIFIVAIAARALHLAQLQGTPFFSVLIGDARGYDEWARRLAGGDWIGTDVFYQAPLYPYFMGVIYAVTGTDAFFVRLAQAVLGSLAAVMLAYAGWRLFSRRVGIVSGAVLALYPAAIFFDGLIQKSSLDLFFTCVALALIGGIVSGARRPRVAWCLLGITVAALSLTRENALLLAALFLVWALVLRSRDGALMLVAGMAIVFAPVVIRNLAVGGGFYLTTSQLGSNFFIGNNPLADGTYMSLRAGRGDPEFERQDAVDLAQQAAGRTLTPGEVSNYWLGRSLQYIREDPGSWLALMARKAALLVNTSEMLDTESQESHAESSSVLAATSPIGRFGILVPLALFGMFVTWSRPVLSERSRVEGRQLWILYALVAAYAGSVILFFVMARYRHPLLPFLILFASAGVVEGGRFFRSAPRSRAIAAVAAALLAAVISNRRMLSEDLMRAISEHNLAAALQESGRVDDAIEHYQRALRIQTDYAPAINNLGTALMAKGDIEDAIGAFRESYRLQPTSTQARDLLAAAQYDLGTALLSQGDYKRAEQVLGEVLRLKPNDAETHNNLGIALASMNRMPEAIGHWRRALAIKPGFADAQRNLAMAEGAR